jgi:hypothetical protein
VKPLKFLRNTAPHAQYHTARPRFRSGDIFAQSHGSWGSWNDFKVMCVRVFTLSTYSHVGVIHVDPIDGHVYAIEAVRPKARRVRLSTIGPFYHLPMFRARWSEDTSFYVHQIIGAPYSQWDAIRAFFKPLPAGTVSECAALTREVLMRCGVDLGPMSRPDSVVQRALELRASITFIKPGDMR